MEEAAAAAAQTAELGRHRAQETWWCTCSRCEGMPTEVESVCCNEWAIEMPPFEVVEAAGERTECSCVTRHEGFLPLLSRSVLEVVFSLPRINWRRRPRPEGPGGTMSVE